MTAPERAQLFPLFLQMREGLREQKHSYVEVFSLMRRPQECYMKSLPVRGTNHPQIQQFLPAMRELPVPHESDHILLLL